MTKRMIATMMFLLLFGIFTGSVFAQGSDLRGVALVDNVVTINTLIVATGSGSHANAGGQEFAGSIFQGSATSNVVTNNTLIVATGSGSHANAGGISVTDNSEARGAVLVDNTVTNNTLIVATGSGSHANAGGVDIKGSKFSGSAVASTSTNNTLIVATGSGSHANAGGISVTKK